MKYTPINPRKISDSIVSHFEDLILNGLLKPGDKLPSERDLAKELDVSRTSLRDALVKLEARGLLQARHSGGTFIRDIIGPTLTNPLVHLLAENPKAMLDLLEIRESLERIAAYYAAERATALDHDILQSRFAALNTTTDDGDPLSDALAIAEYYLAIADASHNIALMHVMRGLFNLMKTSISGSLEVIYQHPGTYEVVHEYRDAMHNAILQHDPEAAADAANAVSLFLHRTFCELIVDRIADADHADTTFTPVSAQDIKPARLSDAVIKQMEQLISRGKLKAGDQIPSEKELAETLSVSRAVLRDAIVRLEARGVLTIKQGGGTYVCDIQGPTVNDPLIYLLQANPEAVSDFLHLRGSLEELCAMFAAERRTQDDLDRMQGKLDDMRACIASPDPFSDAETITDFHLALAEASHNIAMAYIMRGLYSLLRTSIRGNLEKMRAEPQSYTLILEHHEAILRNIKNGDPEAAANAARVHIKFVNESISRFDIEQKRLEQSQRRAQTLSVSPPTNP